MGRAPLLVRGLLISAVPPCFLPGLPALAWYIAVFALNAVGVVTAMPAQKALVGDLTRREHWGRAFGFYTFTASVGTAIGPLLGGLLYDRVGHSVPFYANAVLLVVSAVWALSALRRSQLHSRSLFSMARVGTAWLFQMIWTSLRRVETICLKIRPS
jgi:MFS family permease